MSKTKMRILSAITSLALVAGTAGTTLVAPLASAATGGPTVTLSSTSASTTAATSIPVTVAFSEDVSGFDVGDITLGGTASSSLSGFASTSASAYSFNVDIGSDGTVSVEVPADMASSTIDTEGNQASNVLSFVADATAPTISTVAVTATTSSSATVTWDTNEATVGNLSYGTTTGYGASSTVESTASTTHTATISGLDASTLYHFRVNASDAAGNAATSSDMTFTTAAAATTAAPVISNITVSNVGSTTAIVSWNTDIAATGTVWYGTTTSYGSSMQSTTTASTTQSVMLSGLSEGTLYHFAVSASNGSSTSTSTDQSFATQSTASSTPLLVTGVDTVSSTAIANNTFADGWKWVMHLTVPDNEDAFRIRFSDWAMSSTTSFPANGNIRISSPQSSNASTAENGFVATGNGYSNWLYLTGDTSSTTPGRQIDLTIEVKIPFGTPTGSYSTTYTAQSYPQTATSTAI